MTTYIVLGEWTEQGVRAIADSPKRLDAARTAIEEMGGSLASFHMTMGDCDFVMQIEAPDDAVAARFALLLGRMGNVRTRTLKAFPEQAYRRIVASVS
jgi:uncharacterized protein with GYD domain